MVSVFIVLFLLSFVHIHMILLFPSFIFIFYQTNILRYPVHDVIL